MIDFWLTYGPRGWIVTTDRNPTADNENLKLLPDWMTPAEVLQWVGREKRQMRKELSADFRLRFNRKHRLDWENLEILRRCITQHYHRKP